MNTSETNMKLTPKDHAKIFNAYLSRISLKDVEKINEAIKKSWIASSNYSISTQMRYQQEEFDLVEEILSKNFLKSDLFLIEEILEKTTA
mgnify:CR=1 FL=1